MKDFFQQFLINSDLNQSPNEILQSLSKFRISVNPEVCKRISSKQLIDDFEKLFFRFFNFSESESASIRVATFPALISFLSKMIRYYPNEIQTAFIHFATKQAVPSKGSIIIVSIFAYICNFIAKPFLEKFLNSVPFFHHFTMGSGNSDQLFHVISWLPVFDFNNLIAMLVSFLNQYKATHNLQLLNPIKTIVEMNPDQTIPEILKNGDMTIIAYLFTTLKIDGDKYDLKFIAHQALEKLKTAEFSEIEDCFQILSIQSSSFQTNIEMLSESELKITLNDNVKTESITLQISDYENSHPYFYSLKLPNSLLFPKKEDSSSILAIKFQTISRILANRNKIMDVSEYIEVFDKFCCGSNLNDCIKNKKMSFHFDEAISSALRSFASSLPCLIANSTDFKLVRIIKFIINAKIKSWIHGVDVLHVIEALENKLFEFIPLKERVLSLLSFAMNKNEVLSEKAIEIISKITTPLNFVYITDLITKDIDFFSHFSIQKHLRALSKLIRNPIFANQNRKHLKWIYSILLCVENDYLTDLYTLSEVLNFMQFIFKSPMKRLVDISHTILIYAILYLKGKDFTNTISAEFTFYGEKVDNYLNKKLIDITSKHPFNFIENFPLIYNAFSFYMRQQKEKRLVIFMIEQFFDYFPNEATMKLSKYDEKMLLNKLYKKLTIVTDVNAISTFCKMMPKNDFFVVFAKYYLTNSNLLSATNFYNFITFLDTFDRKYEAMIIVSLLDMDKKIVSDVVLQCLQNHTFSAKYSKELSTFTSTFCKTEFSMKTDEEKLKIVRDIIDKESGPIHVLEKEIESLTYENNQEKQEQLKLKNDKKYLKERNDIIEFALSHLEGWEKIIFQDHISVISKEEQRNIEPRAFISSMKLKTRVLDDVKNMFLYYVDTYQVDKIKYVLRLSVIRNEIIDIDELKKNHKIPENVQQMVIKFYRKRRIKTKESPYEINNQIKTILDEKKESEDNNYSIFHLSKNQLKNLYYNRKFIENSESLFKLFTLLIENYKNNNFHVVLLLFCALIKDKNGNSIPNDFVEFYFNFIKSFKSESDEEVQPHLKEICYSLFLLSRKVKFSYEQNQIMRSLFGLCHLNSVDTSYLLSTMIFIENSNNEIQTQIDSSNSNLFVFGNLNDVIKNLIESDIPSLFLSGLRILRQIHSLPNIHQIGEIIEPFISPIFNKIQDYQNNYPIIFFFKQFLLNIFSLHMSSGTNSDDEKKVSAVQIFSLNNIIPLINENDDFLNLIGPSINCCRTNMKNYSILNNDDFNIILNNEKSNKNILNSSENLTLKSGKQLLSDFISLSDNLISIKSAKSQQIPPINAQKLIYYIRSLHFRVKAIEDKSKREIELMNHVMKYVQTLRNFDNYKIRDVYNEWLNVVSSDLSFELAIKLLLHKFMTNSMRFFPIFVIVAKEVKKIINDKDGKDAKCIDLELTNAIKVIHDDMHVMALQGLIDRRPFQEILDIALIENYA